MACVSVAVDDDGTFRLSAAGGPSLDGIGRIVDGGDFGDSYNYGPPAADRLVSEPTSSSVHVEHAGPVRGRLRVERTYAWPTGVTPDGAERSGDTEQTVVVTELELRAGEPFVRVAVSFVNHSNDHRVRFHAPLPRQANRSHAEGQFAVVERGTAGEGGYHEEPLATYPAHGWVDAGGLAILLDHLTEYELTADGSELAVTLLRSIGLISRNDNPYRQDPAGPAIAIPNAQMRGRNRMTFGLYPHDGDWADGGVVEAAERYRHDLLSAPGTAAGDASWPPHGAGDDALALTGAQVELSSLRRRADGWLEARIVNLAPEPRTATVAGTIEEARRASLRGEPLEAVSVTEGGCELELGPAEIATIQLRRRESAAAMAEILDAPGPRQSI